MSAPGTVEYRFARGPWRGTQLTLHPGRLLHDGGSIVEHMPLAHVAAVRIEFRRDGGRAVWAAILLVVALALAMAAAPLQTIAAKAAGEVAEQSKRDGGAGSGAVLLYAFQGIERAAASLPAVGAALGACAAVLLALYVRGMTVLTVVLSAAEREYPVGGRDHALMEFAEALSVRLAERSG